MNSPAVVPFEPDQPTPLFRPLSAQEPYPLNHIPPALLDGVQGIFGRTQAPLPMITQSVLAAAALAAQREVDVTLHTGQTRPTSLYLVTVAESGERKSSADWEAAAPARVFEQEMMRDHAQSAEEYRIKQTAWETRDKEIRSRKKADLATLEDSLRELGPPHHPPMQPILIAGGDPTFEGTFALLEHGPGYCGIYSAEGGQFTGGHAMNQDNKLKTAAGMSGCWDGDPLRRIRKGDGATVLAGRRVSLHLMIQPVVSAAFLSDRVLLDQGFLSRVLVAFPESNMGKRFGERTPETEAALARYLQRMNAIWSRPVRYAEGIPGQLDPRPLGLEPAAETAIKAFAQWVERQLKDGCALREISGFANKLAEHATRLAGVFAYVENPDAQRIPFDQMERGIQVARWYAAEAFRLYNAGRLSPELVEAERVRAWLTEHWTDAHISITDLVQRGPNFIRESAKARKVIAKLEEHGWLKKVAGPTKILDSTRREAWRTYGRAD